MGCEFQGGKKRGRQMRLYIKNGKVLVGSHFEKINVLIENGRIQDFLAESLVIENAIEVDASNRMVIPGLIDIHTHGGGGIDINHADEKDLVELTQFFASQGTTSFLATVLTDTEEKLIWCMKTIKNVKESDDTGAEILGIHMEGPYLCSAYKGAMPERLLVPPSIEQFQRYQEASGNHIRLITISPEQEGALAFIEYAKKNNVVVSLGHTGADYDRAMSAIQAGAKSSTHLFNAMIPLHQHRPGIIGAALESDIYCEMICDGRHLHPGIVRLIIKTKGKERVIAVTDSIMAAGLPDGNYKLGVNDIIVKDGDAQLADGSSRAGSTLTTIEGLKNVVAFTGQPIEKCIDFFTKNPATLLEIQERKGTIEKGKDADIVIMDKDFNIHHTLVGGKEVYKHH